MFKRLFLILLTFLLLLAVIAATFVHLQIGKIETEVFHNLQNVSKSRSESLTEWLREREGDALTLQNSPLFVAHVEQLSQPSSEVDRSVILNHFELLRQSYNYESILLVDVQGNLMLGSGYNQNITSVDKTMLRESANSKRILHTELYRDQNGKIQMDWVVPLLKADTVIANVILRVNPANSFFGITRTWITSSKSAEIMLVRRDGDYVLGLNELRHRKNSALQLRMPLSTEGLPAAAAVMANKPGTMYGRDYRGMEVLSAYQPVNGTNWRVVAKMDRSEVLTEVWAALKWMVSIAILAILMLMVLLWRLFRQQVRLNAMTLEHEKSKVFQQLQSIGDNLPAGYVYQYEKKSDGRQVYNYISSGVQRVLGLSPDQIRSDASLFFTRLDPELAQTYAKEEEKSAQTLSNFSMQMLFHRENNKKVWLEVSSRPYRNSDGSVVWDGVAMDITERKLTEARLERLNNFYAALNRIGEAIFYANDEDQLFREICTITVDSRLMAMSWVGKEDTASQRIVPYIKYGQGVEYLDDIFISTNQDLPEGRGVTGIAWCKQQPSINNNLAKNPAAAPWGARIAKYGWKSCAAFPIFRNGKVYAVFSVYHYEIDVFDDQIMSLLNSMITEISFALDMVDARHALEASEGRFRKLFEDSRQPMLLLEDGLVVDANEATLDLMKLDSLDELIGLGPAHFSAEYQPDGKLSSVKAAEVMEQAIKEGSNRFEWEQVRSNGEHFIADVTLTPILFDHKTLLHVVWSDITERVKLQEQYKQFKTIVQSSNDAIISKSLDCTLTSWNPAAENIFGYTAEEMIGNKIYVLIPPERMEEENFIISKIKQGENVDHYETERVRKDGRRLFVSLTVSPIYDNTGKIVGASKIARDITEQKRQEVELESYRRHLEDLVENRTAELKEAVEKVKVSEERYENAASATSDGLWDWNIKTGQVYYNPGYFLMLGYQPEDFGQHSAIDVWQSLLHPEDRDQALAKTQRAWMHREGYETEFRMRCKDGSYKWILSRGKVVAWDVDGSPLRMVGTHVDQSIRKQMETALLEAKLKAEAANQAKSAFLANMSHEIRTPMNAILGFTHLLERDIRNPNQRSMLHKIRSSSKHLLGLINDILDLSKIEAERLSLEASPFRVGATIAHVDSMMTERLMDKGLQLIEEIDPRLMDMVLVGDSMRVEQILINYIGNAVKFTEKGHIILRAGIVEESDEKLKLRFEVEDTGIGISEAHIGTLFDDFVQAESSTTRKYGGTGLGLAINQRLAKLMGGEVGVTSTLGKGSNFWVTIWLKRGSNTSEPVISKANNHQLRKGALVLLVEDNKINQELAKTLLENAGLIVQVANHGAEALQMVQQQSYDLILMDMQMPVMDGLEATRQIRQIDAVKAIPILAMTANAFIEDRQQCFDAGMNDFIVKPVEPNLLYRKLSQWIPAIPNQTGVAGQKPEAESSHSMQIHQKQVAQPEPSLIDHDAALKFFEGDWSMYQRMLEKFDETCMESSKQIQEKLRAGDHKSAQRQAHSLKGSAATLGMETVRLIAFELEQNIRNEADQATLTLLTDRLGNELVAVRQAIQRLLTAGMPSPAQHEDITQLKSLMAELESRLIDDSPIAIDVWRKLKPGLIPLAGDAAIAKLDRRMAQYDLEQALTSLRAIMENINLQ